MRVGRSPKRRMPRCAQRAVMRTNLFFARPFLAPLQTGVEKRGRAKRLTRSKNCVPERASVYSVADAGQDCVRQLVAAYSVDGAGQEIPS
jgi:hypothetical protein